MKNILFFISFLIMIFVLSYIISNQFPENKISLTQSNSGLNRIDIEKIPGTGESIYQLSITATDGSIALTVFITEEEKIKLQNRMVNVK